MKSSEAVFFLVEEPLQNISKHKKYKKIQNSLQFKWKQNVSYWF
jgi:hypothetical protein